MAVERVATVAAAAADARRVSTMSKLMNE